MLSRQLYGDFVNQKTYRGESVEYRRKLHFLFTKRSTNGYCIEIFSRYTKHIKSRETLGLTKQNYPLLFENFFISPPSFSTKEKKPPDPPSSGFFLPIFEISQSTAHLYRAADNVEHTKPVAFIKSNGAAVLLADAQKDARNAQIFQVGF